MALATESPRIGETHLLTGLDLLRSVAISLVLLYHYQIFQHPAWVEKKGHFGWTGVDLFFVLSGFLIAGQVFRQIAAGKPISARRFYLKRFFRIIPAYAVVVMIYFLMPAFREREALPPFWKFLTFTQNFGLNLRTHGCFSHAWSLCIEEQFYLLFPLLLIALPRTIFRGRGIWLLPILFFLGFVFRLMAWNYAVIPALDTDDFAITWYRAIYYPFYTRLDGLLAGVSLAALVYFRPALWRRISTWGNALLAAGLLLITAAYFLCEDQHSFAASIFGFPLLAIAYGFIVASAISPGSVLFRVDNPVTKHLAILSFSLYLTHKGVIHLAQIGFAHWGIAGDSNLMLLLCLAVSILAALAMRQVVEKPFLALRDTILYKKHRMVDAAPARIAPTEKP